MLDEAQRGQEGLRLARAFALDAARVPNAA